MNHDDRIVGYIGAPGLSTRQSYAAERRIRDHAERNGWRLHETYTELDSLSRTQFEEMVSDLQRTAIRRVVIPSFDHLAAHLLLQNVMIQRLENDLDVDLHVLDEHLDEHRAYE